MRGSSPNSSTQPGAGPVQPYRHHSPVLPWTQLDNPRSAPALTQLKSSSKGRSVSSGVIAVAGWYMGFPSLGLFGAGW